jgi:hypothetical protein
MVNEVSSDDEEQVKMTSEMMNNLDNPENN